MWRVHSHIRMKWHILKIFLQWLKKPTIEVVFLVLWNYMSKIQQVSATNKFDHFSISQVKDLCSLQSNIQSKLYYPVWLNQPVIIEVTNSVERKFACRKGRQQRPSNQRRDNFEEVPLHKSPYLFEKKGRKK